MGAQARACAWATGSAVPAERAWWPISVRRRGGQYLPVPTKTKDFARAKVKVGSKGVEKRAESTGGGPQGPLGSSAAHTPIYDLRPSIALWTVPDVSARVGDHRRGDGRCDCVAGSGGRGRLGRLGRLGRAEEARCIHRTYPQFYSRRSISDSYCRYKLTNTHAKHSKTPKTPPQRHLSRAVRGRGAPQGSIRIGQHARRPRQPHAARRRGSAPARTPQAPRSRLHELTQLLAQRNLLRRLGRELLDRGQHRHRLGRVDFVDNRHGRDGDLVGDDARVRARGREA